MENKWSEDQSTQITSLYGKLKGAYERKANQKLFGGPQLPYSDAFSTLTALINEQEKSGKTGIERKVKESNSKGLFAGKEGHALGLISVLIAVTFASLGMPYTPPIY